MEVDQLSNLELWEVTLVSRGGSPLKPRRLTPETLEAQPGAVEAYSGAADAHIGAMEAHAWSHGGSCLEPWSLIPGGMEAHPWSHIGSPWSSGGTP